MAILVRATDGALRDPQADLLKQVIPIINAMEIINSKGANLTSDSLCARTILNKLGPQKWGPRGNPYTAVALYVAPNHLETLHVANVSVHMDSQTIELIVL